MKLYAPHHTVAIPSSGEATHVIDGLLYHEANLSIAVHHTDKGGASDHVFALAHLSGTQLAPRIPNLAARHSTFSARDQNRQRWRHSSLDAPAGGTAPGPSVQPRTE